jgi:hypothetical protein
MGRRGTEGGNRSCRKLSSIDGPSTQPEYNHNRTASSQATSWNAVNGYRALPPLMFDAVLNDGKVDLVWPQYHHGVRRQSTGLSDLGAGGGLSIRKVDGDLTVSLPTEPATQRATTRRTPQRSCLKLCV